MCTRNTQYAAVPIGCAHWPPHRARYAMRNAQLCSPAASPCTIRNAQCTAVLTGRLTCTIRNTQCTAVPTACCANTQRGYSMHSFQCAVQTVMSSSPVWVGCRLSSPSLTRQRSESETICLLPSRPAASSLARSSRKTQAVCFSRLRLVPPVSPHSPHVRGSATVNMRYHYRSIEVVQSSRQFVPCM